MTLQEIVNTAVMKDVDVTMFFDKDKNLIKYNMNTGAKSHLYLSEQDGRIVAEMRYNETAIIEDFQDLVSCVLKCMCGGGYVSMFWMEIFIEYGYYKKKTYTQTEYVRS